MKTKITFSILFLFLAMSVQAQLRYAGRVTGVSREYNPYPRSWCAAQILGEPNVYPQYDDIDGAWTPEDYGDQRDWISLGFNNSSPIDSILIWETSGAGIVDSVFVKNPSTQQWQLVFSRKGKNYPSGEDTLARILRIGFPVTAFNVNEIKIGMATDSSSEWVEIDAVAIHPVTILPNSYVSTAGKAASFDGVDDYYRTNFNSYQFMKNNRFTAMCWLKVTADSAPQAGGPNLGAGVMYDAYFSTFGLMHGDVAGGADSLYAFVDGGKMSSIGIPYTKNQWMHVAMVNTPQELKVYVNGQPYKTKAGDSIRRDYFYGLVEFGRNYDRRLYFKGDLDEVKFFPRALSDKEVYIQHYSIGQAAADMGAVGYWQFDSGTDSAVWNTYHHLSDSLHNGTSLVTSGSILSVAREEMKPGKVYPNPNQGSFVLQLNEAVNGAVPVRIINTLGKTVFENTLNAVGGRIDIQAAGMAPGIYILQAPGQSARFVVE